MDLIIFVVSKSEVKKKLQLLSMAPQNCSLEVISLYFKLSTYMVDRSLIILRKMYHGKVNPRNVENVKIYKIF